MMSTSDVTKGKVAIVGSGLIGRSWAVIFSRAGFSVTLYDTDANQVKHALEACFNQLQEMENSGSLMDGMTASKSFSLISGSNSLEAAIKDAFYVQECVPEVLELKKRVFEDINRYAKENDILASSTSCLMPSLFTANLKYRSRCIVAHPHRQKASRSRSFSKWRSSRSFSSEINPPYYIPLVEIIPAPWTDADVIEKTRCLMKEIGQAPILAKKEVNGFILNRLQYAVIMEAWRLVQDDVCSAEDIDTAVTEGLGLRYSLIGPFQTMHLNAAGVKDYCAKYGENIEKICQEQGKPRPLTGNALDGIQKSMCEWAPLEALDEKRKWRDAKLAEISKRKKQQ